VPVLDTQHGNKPLGIIVLRIDPTIYLYPLLQSWPTPTASAETLLVRRDGNDVLFLNDLRFRADAALNLRINLSNTNLPAANAILGQQGIVSGLDYRGKQVIAALNAVPDSPWHLVTKMDRSEVLAPLQGRLLFSALLVFLLIFGIGALTYLLWRQQLLKSALVLREQGERFRDILQTMLDGFLLLDMQGRVLETNKTYCQMSGYSEQELLTLSIADLEALESAKDVAAHIQKILAQGQNRFESKHRRKDGSVFDVEASVQFRTGEGKELVVFLHDISNRKKAQKTLSESEQKFRVMAEGLPQIIWMTTADGLHIYFNPQWVNFTGLTLEESYGHGWITPFHPDDKQRAWDTWQQATQNDSIYSLECRLRRFDGTYRWWLIRGESLHDINGKVINWFGTYTDIQDMKESEENLKLAASVFTHAREGIIITSDDRKIIRVNNAFSEITGYSPDEVLGLNPRLLSSGLHENEFYDALWADLNKNDQWHGEIWNRRKNGEIYAVLENISAVRDDKGRIRQYVALMTDITLIKEHEHVLEHSAHFDILTGLPNRALLSDRLQQGIAQTKRREQGLAVAFLDLDGFKGVNDKHGHLVGDQLLKTLSGNMKQALREIDTLARIGGDEFVAVLLDIGDIETCEPMLTRLLAAAAKPVQFGDISLQVSASLGVSFYPQKNEVDPDLLVRQADQAMYEAKLMGRNRFHVFNAELDNLTRARHESLERIRQAFAAHEFVLYYQPKVNIRKGLVVGAEALVRWQHPDKGLLAPADFLPLIENHPLAIELGEWVIDTALNQIEDWHKTGLDIPVSVNIGARHLQQNDFVARLRALLAAHPAIKPGSLEMEVLETSAMEDLARASQIIKDCHEMGVMFALDDFGTGYSSLTYLKRLPVGQIKIDQSFVRDMLEDPDDLAILEGVIKLSGSFRRQVIAEGVETVEHGVMLLQLGCELAQGFGIAHPMPASDLQSWAAVWSPDPAWINVPSVSSDDIPLLFATVEHRAWIVKLEAYLKGEQEAPPPMDPHLCSFGSWLDAAYNSANPTFQNIELIHQQVHALASELLEFHVNEHNTEALARLGELHALRDALLEQLKVLAKEHWQPAKSGAGSKD
ncbi:MAG: EAL domain-containing protein, partial [Methylococcaceae bacterium]